MPKAVKPLTDCPTREEARGVEGGRNLARDVPSEVTGSCEPLLIRWFAGVRGQCLQLDPSKERVAVPSGNVNPAREQPQHGQGPN
jgi:hypothetical protein